MHSSGYAQAQNANNFGVAANETFAQRQEIEKNREIIEGYNRAKVAQRTNMMPKARTFQQELEDKKSRGFKQDSGNNSMTRQKYNSRLERGGLRYFESRREEGISGTTNRVSGQAQKPAIGAARTAEARQAMAQRFNGSARPVPKTGGFGSNFGRH